MARRVILCLCLILSASLAFGATSQALLSSNDNPRITTGATSYSPGTYVQIRGTNFGPSTAVTLIVSDTSITTDVGSFSPITAHADAYGAFTASWYFKPNALGKVFRIDAVATNGKRAATVFSRTNSAASIIDNFYSGWYSNLGGVIAGGYIHESTNGNTAVGRFNQLGPYEDELRNFFVFDLSGASGTATAAVLHIENPCTSAIIGMPTPYAYTLYDVTTTFPALYATYHPSSTSLWSPGVKVWFDLGSGTTYGNVLFPPADATAPIIDVPLNDAALAAINNSLGKTIAFGGRTSGPGFMMACGSGIRQSHLEITGVTLTSLIRRY